LIRLSNPFVRRYSTQWQTVSTAVASGFLGHIARDPTLPRFGTDCFATALRISELNQLEFGPEASVGAVEEGAELAAVDVVLNIARIPVVCDVED